MKPGTLLLTLGRLPKGLDVARSFQQAGWRVIVAEPLRNHLCAVSRSVAESFTVPAPASDRTGYLEALADIARRENVSLIVPVSEETLFVAELAARLPDMRVYCPPPQALRELHDKQAFIALAQRLGLSAPETARVASPEARTVLDRTDVVVKPVFSCSGRGVRFHDRGDEAALAPQAEPALVQRRIQGEALSSFSITHQGRVLGTVVYRGLVMSGTVAVCFERLASHRAIETWVETFVRDTAASGFRAFDFIVDEHGTPWAIECNPRLTSGAHFIDPRDLAPAIAAPESLQTLCLRPEIRLQQFYPVLTESQSPLFWRKAFRDAARYLFTVRDVSWSWRDPLPLLLQPLTSAEIIARSMRQQVTLGEAATLDIEWRPADTGHGAGLIAVEHR